jgi:hypothetical protein
VKLRAVCVTVLLRGWGFAERLHFGWPRSANHTVQFVGGEVPPQLHPLPNSSYCAGCGWGGPSPISPPAKPQNPVPSACHPSP